MKNAEKTQENTYLNRLRNIIMHHLGSFQENDLDGVISDYTNESVLITQDAIYKGPQEIKGFFAGLMLHFPKQNFNFVLEKLAVDEELVYIAWRATTPTLEVVMGTDTFIIRKGKIFQQTFAGQLKYL